jgi:hypothetical protein
MAMPGVQANFVSWVDVTGRIWSTSSDKPLPVAVLSSDGSSAITEATPVAASVVVAAGPIATTLAVNNTFVASCIVVAKAGNANNIMIGTSSSQIVPLAAGSTFNIICGQSRKTDLNDWYINGTAGQGVDILYAIV